MSQFLPISPYITAISAIFLNFIWIYFRQELSLESQVVFLALSIFLITLSSILAAVNQKGKRKLQVLIGGQWVLFIYYLYILCMLLFFGGLFQVNRIYQGDFQLVPFHTIDNYINFYRKTGSFISLSNLLGNIFLMMPLGYFIPTLFPKARKFWVFIPIAAAFALGVEIIQWKTGTGIGDIDDSILNFLGAVLVYGLTRANQLIKFALKP